MYKIYCLFDDQNRITVDVVVDDIGGVVVIKALHALC